jgi:DNA-binding response OmpR family regulator
MRVLLVEDDEMIGHSLKQALAGSGWSVDWVKDGLLAQSALADGGYSCVLLDLGLPKRDGIEVLRQARSQGDRTPVLVLTARDGVDARVTGLDIGADDYLVKPYELQELLARMRAVIRRRDGSAHSVIGSAALQLDLTTREVLVQGERSQLSAREFALLHALLERPGAILSRDQLENRIYGWGEEVSSNAVDVLIHGMRRKLGPDAIRNVRGLGWRVAAPAAGGSEQPARPPSATVSGPPR